MLRLQPCNRLKPNFRQSNPNNPNNPNNRTDFTYVREWDDPFLNLFPHRNDYLWAEYPAAGERPQWHTQSRHPLSDRQIKQGASLLGVRFGPLTHYVMLDIDPDSAYHPEHDPLAIPSIMAALEPLGLVAHIAVRSSSRSGIHLYLPFQTAQKSWAIARATAILLTNQGFILSPGHLELFPNPKPYGDTPTLYNGHRLPLQAGSYLLNQEWEPTYSTQSEFVRQWHFAQNRNDVSSSTIEQILKAAQHKAYRKLRAGGQKYLNDLNAEIEPGWTAPGQTNFLLGKIANRERVFHHVLWGGEPLTGEALAQAIAQVARSLPGFETFCRHQTELEQKAKDWARSAEHRYYPYPCGSTQSQTQPKAADKSPALSWNQMQAQAARDRIRHAIADLLNQSTLPSQPTARRHAIRAYGIGNKTLDKNRDLWHPNHLEPRKEAEYHPIATDSLQTKQLEDPATAEYHPITPNKLRGTLASDVSRPQSEAVPLQNAGGSGGISTGELSEELSVSERGIRWIQGVLSKIHLRKEKATSLDSEPLDSEPLELYDPRTHSTSDQVPASISCSSANRETTAQTILVNSATIAKSSPIPSITEDTSNTIAAIQVQTRLLNWTSETLKQYIASNFNGKTRAKLTPRELIELLDKLKQLRTPYPE